MPACTDLRVSSKSPRARTSPIRCFRHGPIRVAADRRHLEHADGTPFLWLGDTWWMGLCRRLRWPDDVRELAADRAAKGFNVIHLVAGLYPDMDPFDERGAGDGGFPWAEDFSTINPAYFDAADLRIAHLVRSGMVPCVVGFWGYFLDVAGAGVLKAHWRNLIARWGAYPVAWCVAGEALMPFYTSEANREMKRRIYRGEPWLPADRRAVWSDMSRYIKETDGHGRLLTIHPTRFGTDQVDDPATMDLHWLQTGHNGYPATAQAVDMMEKALAAEPRMPVLDSEGNYEMIRGTNRDDIQRFQFWSTMLVGAGGLQLRRQRHLAGGPQRPPVRRLAARHHLGRAPVGRGDVVPGIHAGGRRQADPGALRVVALRAAPGVGRSRAGRGGPTPALRRRHRRRRAGDLRAVRGDEAGRRVPVGTGPGVPRGVDRPVHRRRA